MRAQNAGDAKGCVTQWDADGVLMPPNEPRVRGSEALLSWYVAAFDEYGMDFEIFYEDIHVSGDWSFANGTYSGVLKSKRGGNAIQDSGKVLEIHRRQSDGSWRFAGRMWSSDRQTH